MHIYFDKIKLESPKILNILNKSNSLEEAREELYRYLKEIEWEYRKGTRNPSKLEYSVALESIKVFIKAQDEFKC